MATGYAVDTPPPVQTPVPRTAAYVPSTPSTGPYPYAPPPTGPFAYVPGVPATPPPHATHDTAVQPPSGRGRAIALLLGAVAIAAIAIGIALATRGHGSTPRHELALGSGSGSAADPPVEIDAAVAVAMPPDAAAIAGSGSGSGTRTQRPKAQTPQPLDPYAQPAHPATTDCNASCAWLGSCGLRSANCVAECTKTAGYNGCVASAQGDCDAFAACFLAPSCGPVGRGTATCNDTLTCQLHCEARDKTCACRCAGAAAHANLAEWLAYNTCTAGCAGNTECITSRCTGAYNRCRSQ
jgi:hypothetical protein